MDTSNRNQQTGRPEGQQEWESSDLHWDNMKEGIFGKILEEDPQFFEEKRRRRLPVWIFLGTAVVLLGGVGFWQGLGHRSPKASAVPSTAPVVEQRTSVPAPIAEEASILKAADEHPPLQQPQAPTAALPKAAFKTNSLRNAPSQPAIASATTLQTVQPGFGQEAEGTADLMENSEPTAVHGREAIATMLPENLTALSIRPFPIGMAAPLTQKDIAEKAPQNPVVTKDTWRIAAMGGAQVSFSNYSGSSSAVGLRNDHTSPYLGYHVGASAWMPLSKNNYLLFGLEQQVSEQQIDIHTERQVDYLYENALISVTHYVVGGRTSHQYGDKLGLATEKNRLLKYNRYAAVQAQLGFAKAFTAKNWNFSPYAGLSVGLFTNTAGKTVAADGAIFTFDDEHRIVRRAQWMTTAGFEVERKLGERYSLLLRYRFDRQWNNASTEQAMQLHFAYHYLSLGAAMRFGGQDE